MTEATAEPEAPQELQSPSAKKRDLAAEFEASLQAQRRQPQPAEVPVGSPSVAEPTSVVPSPSPAPPAEPNVTPPALDVSTLSTSDPTQVVSAPAVAPSAPPVVEPLTVQPPTESVAPTALGVMHEVAPTEPPALSPLTTAPQAEVPAALQSQPQGEPAQFNPFAPSAGAPSSVAAPIDQAPLPTTPDPAPPESQTEPDNQVGLGVLAEPEAAGLHQAEAPVQANPVLEQNPLPVVTNAEMPPTQPAELAQGVDAPDQAVVEAPLAAPAAAPETSQMNGTTQQILQVSAELMGAVKGLSIGSPEVVDNPKSPTGLTAMLPFQIAGQAGEIGTDEFAAHLTTLPLTPGEQKLIADKYIVLNDLMNTYAAEEAKARKVKLVAPEPKPGRFGWLKKLLRLS